MSNIVEIETGWKALASAIIVQAAVDYKKILRRLKKQPDNSTLSKEQAQIEMFFQSSWFKTLSDLDGRVLMQKIGTEVKV